MNPVPLPVLRILHFNDVYNIFESRHEPVGGAARFVSALNVARASAKTDNLATLTAFSGDVFSPSALTPLTAGAEMPPVLNAAHVDIACIGNHDMDDGVDVMYRRMSETTFEWLLSNASFVAASHPDFDSCGERLHEWAVIERAGLRIGFMGLIPLQWIDSLSRVPPEDVLYEDFVAVADRIALILRHEHECDFSVALTHMRQPDDERLAMEAEDVDLILAGHDHSVTVLQVNGRYIVKSGTDFRTFGVMDIGRGKDGKVSVLSRPVMELVTKKFEEDPDMKSHVESYEEHANNNLQVELALSNVDLDGRFCSVRSRETALGNFMVDIMVKYTGAEIGMLNGGSFRSDRVHPRGAFLERDLDDILPFKDNLVLLQLTGAQVLQGLENSVSQYPALEGRFIQVSGIKFTYDPRKRPGARVQEVLFREEDGNLMPLEQEREYRTVVKGFMARGKDGYDCFAVEPGRVISETGPGEDLRSIVRSFLERSGPFEENKCEDTCRAEEVEGFRGGPLTMDPRVEGRIMCVNPDEQLERMCSEEQVL